MAPFLHSCAIHPLMRLTVNLLPLPRLQSQLPHLLPTSLLQMLRWMSDGQASLPSTAPVSLL